MPRRNVLFAEGLTSEKQRKLAVLKSTRSRTLLFSTQFIRVGELINTVAVGIHASHKNMALDRVLSGLNILPPSKKILNCDLL